MKLRDRYKRLSFWNKIGFWGGTASIVGVLIFLFQLIFPIIQKKFPSLELVEITPYLQSIYIPGSEVFKKNIYDNEISEKDPILKLYTCEVEFYSISAKIRIDNSTTNAMTFYDFGLGFDYSYDFKYNESYRYTVGSIRDHKQQDGKILFEKLNPPIRLEPNEIKDVSIHFLTPKFEKKEEVAIKRIAISCKNSDGIHMFDFKINISGELVTIEDIKKRLQKLHKNPKKNNTEIERIKEELKSVGLYLKTKNKLLSKKIYLEFEKTNFSEWEKALENE